MTVQTGGRFLDVVSGRNIATKLKLWSSLTKQQVAGVEVVGMGMGASAIPATQQAAPNTYIVHDRFHVSMPLNQSVAHTRRAESAELVGEGDDTLKRPRFL